MSPISEDDCELMTVAEFAEQVRLGGYNEYDGSGYYATATEVSEEYVDLSAIDMTKYTHVAWYNK